MDLLLDVNKRREAQSLRHLQVTLDLGDPWRVRLEDHWEREAE
jgi:hypothetical protein